MWHGFKQSKVKLNLVQYICPTLIDKQRGPRISLRLLLFPFVSVGNRRKGLTSDGDHLDWKTTLVPLNVTVAFSGPSVSSRYDEECPRATPAPTTPGRGRSCSICNVLSSHAATPVMQHRLSDRSGKECVRDGFKVPHSLAGGNRLTIVSSAPIVSRRIDFPSALARPMAHSRFKVAQPMWP